MTPGPAPTPASLPVGRSAQGTGKCGEGPQLPYLMTPRSSMSITNTKGLLNMPGQNNCFLNSAVQVLWHLDIFRRSFRELSGHACMAESCIFCALKELFAQFQYSQESALPPDALRRALAETFCDQRRFQLGFMDDAAECFENILMRIHFHIANQESEDMCSASHCIPHQKFAMTLVEQTVCHACGATSEPLPFTQMVHYVPSSALCSQAKLMKGKSDEIPGFGELLRRAGGLGDLRDCPSACGAVIQIRKTLMNRPEIVSVGLVWDSERPTIEHIMDVFNTIGMSLKLQDVFHSVVDSRWASTATHQLVGIVTYYGKHYSTFFFHTKLRVWIYFDDAAVREIGPRWEQVVEKCCRGHFQPLLLLYANPYGTSVCTSTAPRTVTVVPGHKKTSNGKDTFGRNLVTEKVVRNHPSNNQRRALTPNPEVSYDLSANVQPRRAVTPSGEISRLDDVGEHQNGIINNDAKGESLTTRKASYDSSAYSQHISNDLYQEICNKSYEPSVYFTHNHELHMQQTDGMKNGKNSSQEKLGVSMTAARSSVPSIHDQFFSDANNDAKNFVGAKNCLSTRPASVDDLLHSSTLARLMGSECARFIVSGVTEDGCFDGRSLGYREDHGTESTYISRKAVENVLHLQKLQRQKSINAKHGHIIVGQRNSSSSLESLENMFLLREKGFNNFLGLKLDIPDVSNIPRRRDSGNWSGDRNSASSSSTTSLDNPYFYIVGNKRSFNNSNRNIGKAGAPDFNAFTDPGYDSFSVSSSDSYPSTVTNSPGKLDPRLGQIPENVQTAFLPFDLSRLQQCTKDSGHGNGSLAYGFKDECERLCIEADIFMAKSVERENVGDLSMAALLSDTAAAKARAAMDAPYSNTQSLALAKLKHSMCVIRSSNLHKKLKEAEAAQRRKQKEATGNVHHSHLSSHNNGAFNHSNNKDNQDKSNDSGHNEPNKSTGNSKLMEMDGYESSGKSIEIYATLPKKSLKKKGALMSFMESLTGEDNSSEKNNKQKTSGSNDENGAESSISSQVDNAGLNTSLHSQQKSKTSNDASCLKSPGSRKKDRNVQKAVPRDSDLSDYSSEWEHTKKSSLYRTYSGPPTDSKGEFGDITKESLNQTFSGHPTKKQHKIRRKLMGGFMRRKNRSLPDLREGQDQVSSVSRSFDDCAISQTPVLIRKLGEQEQKELKNTPLVPKNIHSSPKQMLIASNFTRKSIYGNSYHDEKHNLMTHGQSIGQSPKASPQKHIPRTHTPPPYKPPPPIASGGTNSDLTSKRTLSHNEEPYKQLSQSHNMSLKEVSSKKILAEQQGKQYSLLERATNQHSPAVENRNSFSVTIKQNSPNVKLNYDNALPKGTAVWLKELQMKQEEIIHKRKLQEKWEKQHSENVQKTQFKIGNSHRESESTQTNQLCMQLPVVEGETSHHACSKCNPEEDDIVHAEIPQISDKQTVDDNSMQELPTHPKSVKDLASRFEKILKPCLQSTEACQASAETFTPQQNAEKTASSSSSSVYTEASISPIDMHEIGVKLPELTAQKDNQSNIKETLISDSPRTHYSASSTSGCIYNPHLTEGQLTNMLRIGANRAAFRNSNSALANVKEYGSAIKINPTVHSCEFVTRSDKRRPDKPPDYETAIQRLELIRGDRNIINYISNNYFGNNEASLSFLEQSKKKRGPKKSVTFSDKVVLVACAGDEDNDFIPNPLLERVYKQHLMQKSSMELPTETTRTGEVQHIPQCAQKDCHNGTLVQHGTPVVPNNSTVCSSPKHFSSASSQSPCHLCHKKTVTAPTVYCPDCAFYMSRFQPNK